MATDVNASPHDAIDTPRLVHTADLPIAYIPITVTRDQIREVTRPGIGEVMAAIADQGQAPAGPWFTHHLRTDPALFDFEICVPVGGSGPDPAGCRTQLNQPLAD